MGDSITQDNRLLTLTTTAGKDVLLVDTVTGMEGVSTPFRYVLTLMSEIAENNPAKVIPHQLVGSAMSLKIALTSIGPGTLVDFRYFSGFCERFVKSGQDKQFAFYSATLVPWFSFLNYATNCRIFEAKNVTDIITAVVSAHGYTTNLDTSGLSKTYTPRDYCVQYRETDFAFVSRLMESEGIFYYFKHQDGQHTMMLADSPQACVDLPIQNTFKISYTGQDSAADSIKEFHVEEQMHTGKWTTRDYHHESPDNQLETTLPSTTVASAGQAFETYDYPGDGAKVFNQVGSFSGVPNEEEKLVRARIEAEETSEQTARGTSNCRSFNSGYKMTVQGGDAAGDYMLTNVSHRMMQEPAYRTEDSIRIAYENDFEAIPAATLFVPPRSTPKSLIHGLQTALVVDESQSGNSEEIWPDKYGRIRVRFPWDRQGNYSCWVRVVQSWAGKAWGQQWIPRTGDEVAITFLEGDPDCPVAIGGIYNKNNMPIFTLPDNKTQSGLLTNSSTGGSTSNFNMLRFEDKKDSEEIFIQAEKDWNSLIKHDETRTIKNNRTSTIHVDESRTVETGNDTIAVQQGKRTITVQQDLSTTVNEGNISEEAKQGNVSLKADMGNISTEASMGNISVKADMGNISTQAALGNISEQADLGNITIQASVGSISISGLSGITISCGASSISMTPASISISAPMVLINS